MTLTAELADLLEGPVNRGAACDFQYKIITLAEDLFAGADHLIGMGNIGQIIDRKYKDFWEPAIYLFMLISIFFDCFNNLFRAVRRSNLDFDISGGKLPFVFDLIKDLFSGFGVYFTDKLALLQERAIDFHIRFDFNSIIINKITIEYGLISSVRIDLVLEHGHGMAGRGGGKPDFNRIKMIDTCFHVPVSFAE